MSMAKKLNLLSMILMAILNFTKHIKGTYMQKAKMNFNTACLSGRWNNVYIAACPEYGWQQNGLPIRCDHGPVPVN